MHGGLVNASAEWLETDGLGGYAMGRADGLRTRRYHALLTVARTPPTGRVTLVSGVDAWVETRSGSFAISSQRYTPDVVAPDGVSRMSGFSHEPWPTWHYQLPDGTQVVHELIMHHDAPLVVLSWRLLKPSSARLVVRPYFAVRDAHGTTHENAEFCFKAHQDRQRLDWRPYAEMPAITAITSGQFHAEPLWYRNFQYDEERERGLPFTEDLASPGTLQFSLDDGAAVVAFASDTSLIPELLGLPALELFDHVAASELRRREAFPSWLHRAADAYIVRRAAGRTIVAGYPWFVDWGRDTFIAVRGLCIAGGRLDDARAILLEWAHHVVDGMLPNFFPEGTQTAEYNSVDASLWYVVAVHEYLEAVTGRRRSASSDEEALGAAVASIIDGYMGGTRYGIAVDADGLLRAGESGRQLTWMDAKVGDSVVTPRIGKPVEIQALWINALRCTARWNPQLAAQADLAQVAFDAAFWNEETGCLFDVVDVDHEPGRVDSSIRPNQLLAVGGLPWAIVTGTRAKRVMAVVESSLWTPAGLRSLAKTDAAYIGRYGGDVWQRDAAYHQGTIWPWLTGAYVEAWVRVRGATDAVKQEARKRFLVPLLAHYESASPGQLGEIADGDAPHTARGCPFQAWSVGEAIRLAEDILRVQPVRRRSGTRAGTSVSS